RTLIHFKLLRSQIAILFTTFFLTLVSGRFGQGGKAWIHAAGWWLVLSTLNLHTLAASFARTRLLELGVSNWRRRIVVLSVVALEEASVEVSRKFAERVAAVRAGGVWHSAAQPKKRKSPPFTLRPTGVCAVAFLWKNLISAGHAFTLRTWIFLASFAVCAGLPLGLSSSRKGWLLPAVGILTVILIGYSLFLGPAILRQDLRQDLANADILKMYPLRGWQVVLGELLAPAAILTGVQWCLLLLAATTFSRFPEGNDIPLSTRLSLGAALA